MRDVYILGAARTPIGKFGGSLAGFSAVELGKIAVLEAMRRARVEPASVGELIMGQVIQAGAGSNPARQVSLLAGIPVTIPSFTVNMVCASGMKAFALAARAVAAGEADIAVAGGMESMTNAPYLLDRARAGYRMGDGVLVDAILRDALLDPLSRAHMGLTAERLAEEFGIGRQEQDAFAMASQQKAARALATGAFDEEIAPVTIPPARRGAEPSIFSRDEYPRVDADQAGLAALKPAFKEGGTVTAGNSSGINDGAAALVLGTREEAEKRGLAPLAKVRGMAAAGVDPARMGLGPVPATRAALSAAGLSLRDIQAVELNEAFAAQALAVIRELPFDPGMINMRGGAIALGHPVGASGARIIVTLIHAMKTAGQTLGLATLCVGGGQGMAVILERS
jgi:acetyl-CoA C-acetyltransferase